MTRLFRSKSCGLVGLTELNSAPPRRYFDGGKEGEGEQEESEDEGAYESGGDDMSSENPISTPFISPRSRFGGKQGGRDNTGGNQSAILDILVAVLRKSLITCSVERDDVSSIDISYPTEVRHVSHVTFDRFDGFLGLPTELQPEVPRRVPSASVSVFGVSASSMQCSFDNRGNSVPTILLMMQKRLYSEGGLRAEGIFRITAENSHEEYVRDQLNKGVVAQGIDVHCLAGLIKAWLRELPTGVLDSLTPEQVMHCNTEDDCTQLVKLLPQTEAALLDWAINLMADVVEFEQYNKMNARNIAMVFAPNMTQMADPLTALIHAVQVMNFLKTLILKTLGEREEQAADARLRSSCSLSVIEKSEPRPSNLKKEKSYEQTPNPCSPPGPAIGKFMRTSTLDRLETEIDEKHWSVLSMSDGEEESQSISGSNTPSRCKMGALENECRGECDGGDWLSLRKGVRRLCRHPVFQFSKPAKKTRSIGVINTRGGGGEAWA